MKIFFDRVPSRNLFHLRSLAGCFGIDADLVDIQDRQSLSSTLRGDLTAGGSGAVFDLATLTESRSLDQLEEFAVLLCEHDAPVLLLIDRPSEATDRLLQAVSNGKIKGAVHAGIADTVMFNTVGAVHSKELSSHCYPRKQSEALGLLTGPETSGDVVMTLGQVPSFVSVRVGRATIFIWSTQRIFDVRKPLSSEKEFEEAVDEYIPLIVFLRASFQNRCWHNPKIGADLVIDDPLLKRKYGYIDFQKLLGSARRYGYHVTLAFIPWNHWRSRMRDARLFSDHADCFSICAHGCDHTKNEFGSSDYDSLLRKSFVASERMERHWRRTGITYDPVMVCPQERYSLEAMQALAQSRQFLAVTNTACIARNLTVPLVCAADLLLPAQDAFYGLPVFKRHYWKDMSAFAMGLFLGKPVIVVEHQEFFQNGMDVMEQFVAQLAEIRSDVKWASTFDIATRTHLQRQVSTTRRELRFFTDVFKFEHTSEQATDYQIFRRLPCNVPVERVLVNGQVVPFWKEGDSLRFEIQADRPKAFGFEVILTAATPTKAYPSGVAYQASVALRRGLSELRDSVLVRDRRTLKMARSLMRAMKQSGD